jgi:hypothetical protein
VLEDLARDDDVEALGFERKALVDICPDGPDPESLGFRQSRPVDVEADDLVAVGV